MQTKKIFLFILIIINSQLLIINSLQSQNITADTTLANKHFETAEAFRDSSNLDSAIFYFKKASNVYLYLCQSHGLWLNYGYKYLYSEIQHGDCYTDLWQLDQAINIIKPAIEKTTLQIGENDTIVAEAYKILGFPYYYQSKFDSVLFYFEKTLNIYKDLFGEKHINTSF